MHITTTSSFESKYFASHDDPKALARLVVFILAVKNLQGANTLAYSASPSMTKNKRSIKNGTKSSLTFSTRCWLLMWLLRCPEVRNLWDQCYKTLYSRKLRYFAISWSVCSQPAFPAHSLMFVGKARSLPQRWAPVLLTSIRRGWKGLPGTSALTYYKNS